MKARLSLAGIYKTAMLLTRPAGVIWRSYYYAGSTRIAMREDSDQGSEVYYLLTDHLGSTSVAYTFDEYDQVETISRQWYKPWGEIRQVSGVTVTDYSFTGQSTQSLGMLWYNSRFYDPTLSRFTQADTVVPDPGNILDWNRYQYVRSNPVKYQDPTGHWACGDGEYQECDPIENKYDENINFGVLVSRTIPSIRITSLETMIDSLTWRFLPSAIGIQEGRSFQAGAALEPYVFSEESLVFNWRSGELSKFKTGGAGLYVGTPSLLGGNTYFGVTGYYGASKNDKIVGPSNNLDGSISIDAFAYIGFSRGAGISLTPESVKGFPWQPFVDPTSGMVVNNRHTNINIGGNIAANGIDVGITYIMTYSDQIWSIQLYPWNKR